MEVVVFCGAKTSQGFDWLVEFMKDKCVSLMVCYNECDDIGLQRTDQLVDDECFYRTHRDH